jgi:hypothetical protein
MPAAIPTGDGEPDQEEGASRVEQARRRARRERQQRPERGLEELQKLRPSKPRVSVSEPEARRMRQADVSASRDGAIRSGQSCAVVAKVVRELLPVFGHSAANPTNESALPAQVRPDLTLLALGVVRHEEEVSGAVRQLSAL